jgi:hypothetical protein
MISLRFLSVATIALLALPLMAQSATGIKPRSKPESYPAVKEQPNVILGAAQLSSTQIRKTFVSSLGKDYLVFEIGAFPKSALPLSPQDFMLVMRGGKDVIRPADPDVIAKNLGKKEEVNHDVGISPVAGVGYSTGGDPNDPYPQRGWTTTTGVLVHGGHQKRDPKTIQADRKTMATELKEKQLPTGTTAQAVAGYLYFPSPDKKNARFDLEYQGQSGQVVIPLQPPSQ